MKLSFCITKRNDIHPFGKDEYIPRDKMSELVADTIEWPFTGKGINEAFNLKKTDILDLSVSSFLSTSEKDDDLDILYTDDNKTVSMYKDDLRKAGIDILLGSYNLILAPAENHQSLTAAAAAHINTLSYINKDSVLFDDESKSFVDRNDFAGLLARLQSEKASIVSSDTTFRSKIVALARMIKPFKLSKEGKSWTWEKDRQDVIALEKLVDGILSDDSKNAIKNLKSITLGSMEYFDGVYKELKLTPSNKSDWSFVMIVGQSLNKQSTPFIDAEKIKTVIPIAFRAAKGVATTADTKTLESLKITGDTSQKKCQNYFQAISKGITPETAPKEIIPEKDFSIVDPVNLEEVEKAKAQLVKSIETLQGQVKDLNDKIKTYQDRNDIILQKRVEFKQLQLESGKKDYEKKLKSQVKKLEKDPDYEGYTQGMLAATAYELVSRDLGIPKKTLKQLVPMKELPAPVETSIVESVPETSA